MKTNPDPGRRSTPVVFFQRIASFLFLIFVLSQTAYSQVPVNNLCGNAIPLTSGSSCVPIAGTMNNATQTGTITHSCTGTSRYDVWYTFTAQSVNPVVDIISPGPNWQSPRIQVLSGTCAGFTEVYCGATTAIATFPLNLTVGVTYYIRLFSTINPIPTTNAGFSICITDPSPPANDEPAGAINLSSAATCINTAGNVGNATYNIAAGAVACTGTDRYDVWYTFTAQRVNPTIAVSGNNTTYFITPKIQIFSGTPGSLVSIGCGNAPYTPTTLTAGTTYYVRVYTTNISPLPNASTGGFNICITDPARPANDDCSGSTLLTQGAAGTCSNTSGNMSNALITAGVPGDCGNAASPDVWYRFVATSVYPEIRISGAGLGLTAAGLRVQLLSGSCGSFSSLSCKGATGNSLTTAPTGAPLTIGQVYYVRVYSNGSAPSANTWNFNICITTPAVPSIHFSKTYANVTKGANGGTIEPGDVLEIRAILNVKTNATFNTVFTDVIPANTTYVPGTLRILTNEGKIFRQWTDAADGDPATISGTAVTINLGSGADATSGGSIRNTDRPVYSANCIMVVSYTVQVNPVSYGTLLQVGGGSITYNLPDGSPAVISYLPIPATVYKNYGICTNTIGTNGVLSEFGGTFGSGNLKDRAASGKVPANYTYAAFSTGAPGDYFYGISNNTSASTAAANYSIDPNETSAAKRVFSVWDVIGDHTGATNPLAGNLPADVNNGATGGYMVVINAAYRADTAFLDTVRNLCPNTTYEYSAWFRNICRKCAVDSTGTGPSTAGYVPTGPGDTSGVHPNLTFTINGSDYYTTGDMAYTGQWVKKGFAYRTGPTETQMIINIRNNAPGGGGNDWAIDDIGVATCSPLLIMNPSTPVVNVCYGDGQSLSASVVSYYDNFTHWIWEKSIDNGLSWTSTGYSGNTLPTYNGTEYEYTATGPSVIGDSTTHQNLFRLRVASTPANLADIDCSFRAVKTIRVMVHNCMYVLRTNLTNVSGVLRNSYGLISWSSTNEEPGVVYDVEKSIDATNFKSIGTVNGKAAKGFGDHYQLPDPIALTGPAYYRIAVTENNQTKYSNIVLLSPAAVNFDVKNLVNPFENQLNFDVITPADGLVKVSVLDNFGRVVRSFNYSVYKGVTPVKFTDSGTLSNGVYNLKVEYGNISIFKRMVKVNK